MEKDNDTNTGTSLRKNEPISSLASNYFNIDLVNAKNVYCYSLNFEYSNNKDIFSVLSSRLTQYEAGQIIRDLFKNVLQIDNSEAEPNIMTNQRSESCFVFDNYRNLYSSEDIKNQDIGCRKEFIDPPIWNKLQTDADEISFKLKFKGIIGVNRNDISADYIHFLDILTWQSIFDRGSHFVLQNKNYKPRTQDEGQDLVEFDFYKDTAFGKSILSSNNIGINDRPIRFGFSKNTIQVQKNVLYLQIAPKRELFYPNTTLSIYLCNRMRVQDTHALAAKLSPVHEREMLGCQLYGLKVQDRFTKKIITIGEVTTKRAEKVKFHTTEDGSKQSVVTFYRDKYGDEAIADGNLPCIVSLERDEDGISHYLFEHLLIMDNQKCEISDDPKERKNEDDKVRILSYASFTSGIRESTLISDLQPYLKQFGVRISPKCKDVTARLLSQPRIEYDHGYVDEWDPNSILPWEINEQTRLISASGNLKLAVINWNAFERSNKRWKNFVSKLSWYAKHLKVEKLTEPHPISHGGESLAMQIKRQISSLDGYDVLIFVVGSKIDEFRCFLKFYELETNAVTVCVSPANAKATNIVPVVQKLLHRVNARTGGTNFNLRPSNTHSTPSLERDSKQFIGVHWKHLDKFCMAGSVAYIVNSSGIIRGSYFIEQLGSDSSDRFKAALLNAVCDYYRENDERQPSEVLIYIQITKEDDATKTIQWLKDACQYVSIEFKSEYQLQTALEFTIITVQTDCGDALFRTSENIRNDEKLELQVGTCVDEDIVDDKSFMLVQSRLNHASAIVLPTRFTVHKNRLDKRSKVAIEYISYHLCAFHPVECKMIQLPLPLRAASDYCERAFSNLNALKKIMSQDDYEPLSKRSRIVRVPDPFENGLENKEVIQRLNNMLKPSTNNKYFCA